VDTRRHPSVGHHLRLLLASELRSHLR
jgi:hypothetical protein